MSSYEFFPHLFLQYRWLAGKAWSSRISVHRCPHVGHKYFQDIRHLHKAFLHSYFLLQVYEIRKNKSFIYLKSHLIVMCTADIAFWNTLSVRSDNWYRKLHKYLLAGSIMGPQRRRTASQSPLTDFQHVIDIFACKNGPIISTTFSRAISLQYQSVQAPLFCYISEILRIWPLQATVCSICPSLGLLITIHVLFMQHTLVLEYFLFGL